MRDSYARENLRPEVEQMLAAARAAKPAEPTPIATMRMMDLASAAYFNAGAAEIALEREIKIGGASGDLRALMWSPVAEPKGLPIVLHFHGGGFVFMLPETYAKPCKEIAKAADAIVISVDYRLGPEHPYPAAHDDAFAALQWLRSHASELGGDPERIAVAGESAGGGLAAAVALRAIRSGAKPPAGVAVACAWLDFSLASPAFEALGPDDPLIDTATMRYWRESYAPNPATWGDPELTPIHADLAGYPPTSVVVGGIDPLYDDGVSFAEAVRRAGTDVELHDYDGMPHIFWCFPPLHNLTDATARQAGFLRRLLHN
jgi:acetyl esterase/lipase